MPANTMYRQVTCEKPTATGTIKRTFWTEEKRAVVDKRVKIEEDDGYWSDGWVVTGVYGEAVAEPYVNQMRHAHTKQRKATDI